MQPKFGGDPYFVAPLLQSMLASRVQRISMQTHICLTLQVLSSGKQGNGEQDRIPANHGTVKKAVKQECVIMCPVAKIGHGQTGREFVWADPPAMFSCALQVNDMAAGLFWWKVSRCQICGTSGAFYLAAEARTFLKPGYHIGLD